MKIRHTALVGAGIAALIAAAAASSEAEAADVAYEQPNPWGCYVGIVGGYGFGDADADAKLDDLSTQTVGDLIAEDGKADLGGGMVGGLVGCDYGLGNGLVLGIAGDLSWSGINGDTDLDPSVGVSDYSIDTDVNWLGTVRGKVGFELGDAVIYGTGGLAFAGIETELHHDGLGNIDSDRGTQYGWTLGAGMSYMVSDHLMLGAEYLYVDLGDENYDFGSSGDTDVDINMHIIRGSISYKF
jgi:outer membrane immunogenic protein